MKIYLAGRYTGASAGTTNGAISNLPKYPYQLESYHYIKNPHINAIREKGDTIFLDSGAFSMFTQGVEIDLPAYANFIKTNKDIIHLASNLDAIGAGNEQLSYNRQRALEDMGADVCPVHHVRDNDKWLVTYLEEGYQYIFLGGMVPENTNTLRKWLDHVWHEYLTDGDGRPLVKVHGFGLTTEELMFRYPWESVDSTSWVMSSRFGGIFIDIPRPDGSLSIYKLFLSDQSPKKKDIDSWHFATMTDKEKQVIIDRLAELEQERVKYPIEAELEEAMGFKQGFNIEALSKSYGWRDHFNIEYFRRAMNRRVDRFKQRQETLF